MENLISDIDIFSENTQQFQISVLSFDRQAVITDDNATFHENFTQRNKEKELKPEVLLPFFDVNIRKMNQ